MPAGAIADLVLALDGDELVAVRSDPPGVRIENLGCLPLGFREPGSGTRTVLATGSTARSALHSALVDWKLLSAAQLTGLSAAALELGVEYVKSREVFGAPIATFQTIAHRLADDATAVDGARLLVLQGGVGGGRRPRPGGDILASMAWLFAAETALDVTRDCSPLPRWIRVHGRVRHPAVLPQGQGLLAAVGRPEELSTAAWPTCCSCSGPRPRSRRRRST